MPPDHPLTWLEQARTNRQVLAQWIERLSRRTPQGSVSGCDGVLTADHWKTMPLTPTLATQVSRAGIEGVGEVLRVPPTRTSVLKLTEAQRRQDWRATPPDMVPAQWKTDCIQAWRDVERLRVALGSVLGLLDEAQQGYPLDLLDYGACDERVVRARDLLAATERPEVD